MFWNNIFLSEMVSRSTLENILHKVFNINISNIKYISNEQDWLKKINSSLIYETHIVNTNYPLKVSIYLDETIFHNDGIEIFQQISKCLNMEILLPSQTNPDPYVMTKIDPKGNAEDTIIDIDKYDMAIFVKID